MNDEVESIRDFLSNVGVTADIQLDENDETVIVIPTEQYQLRRSWIEAWFTLIGQSGQLSYFQERLRGAGQTE